MYGHFRYNSNRYDRGSLPAQIAHAAMLMLVAVDHLYLAKRELDKLTLKKPYEKKFTDSVRRTITNIMVLQDDFNQMCKKRYGKCFDIEQSFSTMGSCEQALRWCEAQEKLIRPSTELLTNL